MAGHPNTVGGLTPDQLAKKFARSTYTFQRDFFNCLLQLYLKESKDDEERGYSKLSSHLHKLYMSFSDPIEIFKKICKISAPHTKIVKEKD